MISCGDEISVNSQGALSKKSEQREWKRQERKVQGKETGTGWDEALVRQEGMSGSFSQVAKAAENDTVDVLTYLVSFLKRFVEDTPSCLPPAETTKHKDCLAA